MKRASIISTVVSLLCVASWLGQANGIVFDLVKQYYECKNLKMIEYTDQWQDYFYPDPSVENNYLDDAFYASLGLADLDFDAGMDLIKQIYDEITDDSEFSQCVNKRQYNYYYNYRNLVQYAEYFTDANLPDVKSIVSSLDSALSSDRRDLSELQYYWGFGYGLNLPTLTNFTYVSEFSSVRSYEYINFYNCFSFNYSEWLSCNYLARVDSDKREVRIERTNDYLEGQLFCQLINQKNCPREEQIFYGMTMWSEAFPELDLSGQSLSNYFENMVDAADNLELESFDAVYLSVWDKTAYYKAYKTTWGQADISSIGEGLFTALNSDQLSVQIETEVGSNSNTIVSKLIVTAGDGTQFVIDDCKIDDLKNETIKNQNGENSFQIVFYSYKEYNYYYVEIWDFNSRTVISFYKTFLMITSPTSFLDNATGFLIDGPPQSSSSNKKAASKIECKEMCKNFNKSVNKIAASNSFDLQKSLAACALRC